VKWAISEGFAFVPDLSVRAYATRLVNTRDFDLAAGGLDVGVGKQFAVGGVATLTPYVGWNLVWVGASSGIVDFQPDRDRADAIRTPTAQLQNTGVYDELSLGQNSHNRFYGGLRLIAGVLQLGVEYSYSSLPRIVVPSDAGPGQTVTRSLPAVTALNFMLGLDF
jgi:hypothetical protein